jgi:hypothetical protein
MRPTLSSPRKRGREGWGQPVRTKRLVRCYRRVPQQSLRAGDPPHAKAVLTTPPARSDGFDHKGGSERRTYSQGLTGRQGAARFRSHGSGVGRAGHCEHWEALECVAWSERARRTWGGSSNPSWSAKYRRGSARLRQRRTGYAKRDQHTFSVAGTAAVDGEKFESG